MKKSFLITLLLILGCLSTNAQNIQLHYQLGKHIYDDQKEFPSLITTIEHFKADRWGQTFMFVDLSHKSFGISNAYTEIVRELKFWKEPVAIHLEYNGGLDKNYQINNTYLLGMSYLWTSKDFSKSISVSTSYRYDQEIPDVLKKNHGMQLTTVWNWTSWNRVFTLCGFADLWTKKSSEHSDGVVFVSEPQAWINLNQIVGFSDDFNLSIGTELKTSYNFLNGNKFYILPTLGVKWTFN